MANQILVGSALCSTAGLVLWWSVFSDRRSSKRARAALRNAGTTRQMTFSALNLAPSATERLLAPLRDRALRRIWRLTPSGSLDAMQRRISLAGAQNRWTVERLLAAKVLAALGVVIACMLMAVTADGPHWVIASAVLGVSAFVLPDGLLDRAGRERQERIRDDMPDVIDQIMISVQAGLGFDAALGRVATKSNGPFSDELDRVVQDIRLGLGRGEALRALSSRTDIVELNEFVTAMVQAESYGLSISQVLRVQADELREKRRQRAEERAHTIPVKIVFPLIMCIFPTIFIATLGPAVIRAVNFNSGL